MNNSTDLRDALIAITFILGLAAIGARVVTAVQDHNRSERGRCYRAHKAAGWLHIRFKSSGHAVDWCAAHEKTWRTKVNQRVLNAAKKIDAEYAGE